MSNVGYVNKVAYVVEISCIYQIMRANHTQVRVIIKSIFNYMSSITTLWLSDQFSVYKWILWESLHIAAEVLYSKDTHSQTALAINYRSALSPKLCSYLALRTIKQNLYQQAYIKYTPSGQDHRDTVTGTQTLWSQEIIGLKDMFTYEDNLDLSPLCSPRNWSRDREQITATGQQYYPKINILMRSNSQAYNENKTSYLCYPTNSDYSPTTIREVMESRWV